MTAAAAAAAAEQHHEERVRVRKALNRADEEAHARLRDEAAEARRRWEGLSTEALRAMSADELVEMYYRTAGLERAELAELAAAERARRESEASRAPQPRYELQDGETEWISEDGTRHITLVGGSKMIIPKEFEERWIPPEPEERPIPDDIEKPPEMPWESGDDHPSVASAKAATRLRPERAALALEAERRMREAESSLRELLAAEPPHTLPNPSSQEQGALDTTSLETRAVQAMKLFPFAWHQSAEDVTIEVLVPRHTTAARDCRVELSRQRVRVRVATLPELEQTVLAGEPRGAIRADESAWNLQTTPQGRVLTVTLIKATPAHEHEWPSLLREDDEGWEGVVGAGVPDSTQKNDCSEFVAASEKWTRKCRRDWDAAVAAARREHRERKEAFEELVREKEQELLRTIGAGGGAESGEPLASGSSRADHRHYRTPSVF